ncbi:MAG: GIY-YIG nuclease family protein [Caldilineaceae bacterium]
MCAGPNALVLFLGASYLQGVYLLRIYVVDAVAVTFGRFQGGRSILLPSGDYLYIGSALGQRGATCLAGRLLRHATRCGDSPPQIIRTALLAQLQNAGMIEDNPYWSRSKRCFWHIDYLLDQPTATLTQIIALRTSQRWEAALARYLMAEPVTSIIAPGLGASDDRRATHLLRVDAPASWWDRLPSKIELFISPSLHSVTTKSDCH